SQVFAIPFVAHQRLVSLAQRVAQRGHHGFAVVAVLRGLILVHAHHKPPRILDPDFFHLHRRGIVPVVAFRMYFHSRFSTSARVAALIIPRSATIETDPIPNRFFKRSTMGTRLFTSAVLPGHSSVQSGLPFWSSTMPTTICFRSGR